MLFMNTTMVTVALPDLALDLGADSAQLEWIVSSYNLAFLAMLLPGGAIGDRLGHRRLLVAGILTFGAGSLLGATCHTTSWLITARVLMGLAASVFTPMSLALLPTMFGPEPIRMATAIWTAAGALGGPLGPLLGGIMVDGWGWNAMFWLDGGMAALVLIGCLTLVPSRPAAANKQKLPVGHALLSAASFSLIIWGVIGTENSWSAPTTWLPLALGLITLAVFCTLELRATNPLTELRLLGSRNFRMPVLVLALVNFVLFGMLFVTPTYLQTILGNDATTGGMMLLPVALTGVLGAVAVGPLSSIGWIRPWLLTGATVLVAIGLWICATTSLTSGYPPMLIGMLIAGPGMGIGQSSGVTLAMAAVPQRSQGTGAALLNTIRQLGSVLGIALLGSVAGHLYAQQVEPVAASLPAQSATAVRSSLASAYETATKLPDALARSVQMGAASSYLSAMHAVLVACAASATLMAVALIWHRTRTNHAA